MHNDSDELELNIGFIHVRIKGNSAIHLMRWPLAMFTMLFLLLLIWQL